MSRWTTTRDEFASVLAFAKTFPMFGQISVRLKDGTAYAGLIIEKSVANDSGHSAQATLESTARRLLGRVRLSLLSGAEVDLCALDIETYERTAEVELISDRPAVAKPMTMFRIVLSSPPVGDDPAPGRHAFVVWAASPPDARRAAMAHAAQAFPGSPISPEIAEFRDNAFMPKATAAPGKLIPYPTA